MTSLHDDASIADLLFLERWETYPMTGPAAALRARQLRRANPALVAEIRAELCGPAEKIAPRREQSVRVYPREIQEMVFDAHEKALALFRGACPRVRGVCPLRVVALDCSRIAA